jgi:hypothetical protein
MASTYWYVRTPEVMAARPAARWIAGRETESEQPSRMKKALKA